MKAEERGLQVRLPSLQVAKEVSVETLREATVTEVHQRTICPRVSKLKGMRSPQLKMPLGTVD